jgi:aspartyl-tRNA(Asn)/glutamyl-tRNA(Gln) amidotransferase subunit A
MAELTDLTVVEAAAGLAERRFSSRELTDAFLHAIAADGEPTFDGRPDALNAFARVYEEDARAAADAADARLAAGGDMPPLTGIPVAMKDLYSVAGKPLTASSRAVDQHPERDSDVWAAWSAAGAVLVGHTHTHECAAGGSTDQVGNPWARERTAGGSSGGSASALAGGLVPLATGSDTAGSLRIPSAIAGTSTIKPTYGTLSLRGVIPLSISLDHPGPMAMTLDDCRVGLAAMARIATPTVSARLHGARIALSPRIAVIESIDDDVADGLQTAVAGLQARGAEVVADPPPPDTPLDLGTDFLALLATDMAGHHARMGTDRSLLRQSTRDLLEWADERALTGAEHGDLQWQRAQARGAWIDWLDENRLDAILEPTVPIVAPVRGAGYDMFFTEEAIAYIAFTHTWNWTGFPVASLPAGAGARSGLPVGVSLIGRPGTEWTLLDLGSELQAELGVPRARG